MLDIKQVFLTKNNCYISGKKHTPKGIMRHSTGANNPSIGRYVPNRDGMLKNNPYNNDWDQSSPGGRNVCVHAFIGLNKLNEVVIYQTLPWDMIGWHSGSGSKGNANYLGFIGYEVCEDAKNDERYFRECMDKANQLDAYLCDLFNIPVTPTTLIDHQEGHKLGIASNHGDILHWAKKFNYSMDDARREVKAIMAGNVNKALTNLKEARNLIDLSITELSGDTKPVTPTPTPTPTPSTGFKVGEKVRVKKTATTYATGQSMASFVKGSVYTIQQLQSDRALMSSIVSWVRLTDLEKA